MSYGERPGCVSSLLSIFQWIFGLVTAIWVTLTAYGWAVDTVAGKSGMYRWWHFIVALPMLAVAAPLVLSDWLTGGILVVVGGTATTIQLTTSQHYLLTSGAGLAAIILGLVFGLHATTRQDRFSGFASLCAFMLGLVMIVDGLVLHFARRL